MVQYVTHLGSSVEISNEYHASIFHGSQTCEQNLFQNVKFHE